MNVCVTVYEALVFRIHFLANTRVCVSRNKENYRYALLLALIKFVMKKDHILNTSIGRYCKCVFWMLMYTCIPRMKHGFYRAAAMHPRSCDEHLSVCLSVRLSNAWIVTKRNKPLRIFCVWEVDASTLCLKKGHTCKLSVTLSNLKRFSKFLHYWKAYKIRYKTNTTLPTSP